MARWFSTQRCQSLCDALPHLISRGASRSRARGASRRRAGARGGRARAPAAAPPRASRARRGARAPSWRAAARGRRARAPAAGAPPRRRRAAARLRAGSRGRDCGRLGRRRRRAREAAASCRAGICARWLVWGSGLGPWSRQPGGRGGRVAPVRACRTAEPRGASPRRRSARRARSRPPRPTCRSNMVAKELVLLSVYPGAGGEIRISEQLEGRRRRLLQPHDCAESRELSSARAGRSRVRALL